MTISTVPELISTHSPDGCVAPGLHREVIQGVGATRTLLPGESGSLCLLDSASGVIYTLPTPVVGMTFEFLATVSVTSNAYKIITAAGTQFLIGKVIMGDVTVAQSGDVFTADGSTIRALSADGATKGGLLGETYKVVAISATQWAIDGVCHGAGVLATPFAAS